MSKVNILIVDGTQVKNPSTYDIQFADLHSSNSYTSETGYLVSDMIRANQRTISVSWERLTLQELSSLLQTCSGKNTYSLTYLDFYTGAMRTSTFYPDNRQGKAKKIKSLASGLFSLSFNFIEV